MRYHFFLHYGWFFQNFGKEAVRTFMHTTVIAPLIFLDFPTALESSCAPRKHVPALLSIIFKEYVHEEKLNKFEFVMGNKGNQQKSISLIIQGCPDRFIPSITTKP